MRERAIFLQTQRIKDEEQRLAFLKEACGEDVQLFDRIKRLLAAADSPENFLEPEETGEYTNRSDFDVPRNVDSSRSAEGEEEAAVRLDLSFLKPPESANYIGRPIITILSRSSVTVPSVLSLGLTTQSFAET